MIMQEDEKYKEKFANLNRRALGSLRRGDFFYAAECMAEYVGQNGDRNDTIYKIRQLQAEMEMSCQWWKAGLPKPDDDNMVEAYFIPKLFTVWQDYVALDAMTANNNYLMSMRNRVRASGRDWSWSEIRKRLEAFVANIAVMQLQAGDDAMRERLRVVYQEQKKFRQQMFQYVLTELMFKDSDVEELEQLLLTPTVDNIDQRMIISALTINGLLTFDPRKTRLLLNVYRKSGDIPVKHYALVGWTLNLPLEYYPCIDDLRAEVKRLVDNDSAAREDIAQLQIQLGYCLSAADDSQDFQDEVMPDIINASNIRVTRKGFEMIEEDPMDDILGRSDAEKKMEEIEERMRWFIEKRHQGMDLFFQGFKHMKRYPFFNDISNWLVPFYHEHPDIVEAIDKMGGENGLLNMMLDSPICDNDKYSFIFAFLSIMDRMPKEIVEQCRMTPGSETAYKDWMSDPAILRRNYLQSLYRFFELFPYAESFRNPFSDVFYCGIFGDIIEDSPSVIAGNVLFRDTAFAPYSLDLARHFVRRHDPFMTREILSIYNNGEDSFDYLYLSALATMQDDFYTAEEYFVKCLEICPDSVPALKTYARLLFNSSEYDKAKDIYQKLMQIQENNLKWIFSYVLCCDKLGEHEENLNLLFRLNYDSPDDDNVKILLAKALLMLGRAGEAINYIDRIDIYNVSDSAREDMRVVEGLSLLVVGRRTEAVERLAMIIDKTQLEKEESPYSFANDKIRLDMIGYVDVLHERYGIGDAVLNLFIHEVARHVIARG